jgi:hypothetical protein
VIVSSSQLLRPQRQLAQPERWAGTAAPAAGRAGRRLAWERRGERPGRHKLSGEHIELEEARLAARVARLYGGRGIARSPRRRHLGDKDFTAWALWSSILLRRGSCGWLRLSSVVLSSVVLSSVVLSSVVLSSVVLSSVVLSSVVLSSVVEARRWPGRQVELLWQIEQGTHEAALLLDGSLGQLSRIANDALPAGKIAPEGGNVAGTKDGVEAAPEGLERIGR